MTGIVIDANVLISAAFGGIPLDAVSKAFSTGEVFLSPDVIKEIDGTIRRLSPRLGEEKAEFLLSLWRKFGSLCTILEPVGKSRICRDPKDDAYLHRATIKKGKTIFDFKGALPNLGMSIDKIREKAVAGGVGADE